MENRHVTLDGLTVQRWITEMNPRMSVEQYSESLKARMWGGVLEIRVLSQMCNWSIIAMQERDAHHYVEWLRILPRFSVLSESKYILFVDGCHFDELQPITGSSYAQSWQPFPEFEENIHVPADTNATSQVHCPASQASAPLNGKRGPGRPPGSKNKRKRARRRRNSIFQGVSKYLDPQQAKEV